MFIMKGKMYCLDPLEAPFSINPFEDTPVTQKYLQSCMDVFRSLHKYDCDEF